MTFGRAAVTLVAVAMIASGCDADEPAPLGTVVTVAPPTAVVGSAATGPGASSTRADGSIATPAPTNATPTTTAGPSTTAPGPTVAPSAPGLEGLLVAPGDLPMPVTASAASRPTAVCGVVLASTPIDARANRLADATGATAVWSSVEVHSGAATAGAAFAELSSALASCDWARELPAQARASELTTRFVATPELIAEHPICEGAVTGGVVRTTTDDQPVERREILVVVAQCRELVTVMRIDLVDRTPVDQQPWIGPLIATQLARVAAAV